ncbi:MAG: hypothetical protein HY926_13215, partial [Elusimicrobia bacterium]|nr:hypothetical protein [Elusimicrobiota bacterium]
MEQSPRRSNAGIAILAALLIAGSAVGVMLWQVSQREKTEASGFTLDSVAPQERGPAVAPAAPRSGLDMIDLQTEPAQRAPSEAPAP